MRQTTIAREIMTPQEIDDLIFVAMEGYEGGHVAFESNFGLVAFGDNTEELTADIIDKVQQYFKTGFVGRIRLREFKDTVIEFNGIR